MLVATTPAQRPPDARLLIVDAAGRLRHARRARLAEHLEPGDVVIANDAATIPASLTGVHERTGAEIEIRLAGRRSLETHDVHEFTAVVFGAGDYRTRTEDRRPPPRLSSGDALVFGSLHATVLRTVGHERLVTLRFEGAPDAIWTAIAHHGKPVQYAHVKEPLAVWDVWTRVAVLPVAFEAPSASFVLDWKVLGALTTRGIGFGTVTLAAGLSSTGDPALDKRLPLDEPYFVPEMTVREIARAWERGGRVVALGTTVTRALEHASSRGRGLRSGPGIATQRIGPHTEMQLVDAILTGVHEPGTSHYELLRAFAPDNVLRRASTVLARCGYRAHEFGDSVLLERYRGRRRPASPRPRAIGQARHPSLRPTLYWPSASIRGRIDRPLTKASPKTRVTGRGERATSAYETATYVD